MLNNKKLCKASGFTLVELLVTITILCLLLFAAVPLVNNWVYSAQTREARTKLVQAYGTAKALALRNPSQAGAPPAAAAGLRIVTTGSVSTLLVCKGDPTATACAMGGTNLYWNAALPGNVGIVIAGVTATATAPQTIGFTSRGIPTSGTSYTVSRGGAQNNETSTLY